MSKAFTSEETADTPRVVPPRAPLPAGTPNYVTRTGLALLADELAELDREHAAAEREPEGPSRAENLAALGQRRADLEARLASAELVAPPPAPCDQVRFGATVTVEGTGGIRRYQIVGVDEADAAHGKIAFVSPLARALIGARAGDSVRLRAPRGDEQLDVVSVEYASEDPLR